jgi:hypothetical protein
LVPVITFLPPIRLALVILKRLDAPSLLKFQPNPDHPFFQLALSSPLEGKCRLASYNEEQYGKHIIGNGWSIPVAEFLLGKLVDLFAGDALKTYDDYS